MALLLFEKQGYEQTTVAQIAAAAEVSPATFFNYFPSKEDVIFPDRLVQAEALAGSLNERRPGETPAQCLQRAVHEILESTSWTMDPKARHLVLARARIVASVPTLRARSLLEITELQERWSADLVAAFPKQLDGFAADVLTGAVIGAILAVADRALRTGASDRALIDLVRDAASTALNPGATSTAPPAHQS
ncbi:TetR family transcriptional regulator [Nonomuraea terrae]|uniref:TetR family transcriptional regulator n=1 Tax=Nonomuraea terrae TaxID=2530383 RepID=UPI0037BD3945